MDPAVILADVQTAVTIANLAIQVGEDAAPFIATIYNIAVNGTALTDDERTALLAKEQVLRAQLQAPLPDDPAAAATS